MLWFKKNRCPHIRLYGLYGDEVSMIGKGYRLFCLDCSSLLEGPVVLASIRTNEYEQLKALEPPYMGDLE